MVLIVRLKRGKEKGARGHRMAGQAFSCQDKERSLFLILLVLACALHRPFPECVADNMSGVSVVNTTWAIVNFKREVIYANYGRVLTSGGENQE